MQSQGIAFDGQGIQQKTPSATVQRRTGISLGTHVSVNDGGPVWYGRITSIDDQAGTYDVRVGSTGEVVKVPQAQADYHETVGAVAAVRVSMEKFVDQLPAISLAGDSAAFGTTNGTAAQLVAAVANMAVDADVAQHTLAMFQYMDQHAAAIGGKIQTDFQTVAELDKRDAYLQNMSDCMTRKILKGLWIGGEDRGMIAAGALDPVGYFGEGKAKLLSKAGLAVAANKTLESLLENLSDNLEPKSYGRRQESAGNLSISALSGAPVNLGMPPTDTPIAHNHPGYIYYTTGFAPVAVDAMEVGKVYVLNINHAITFEVTISANTGNTVTFSKVEA